MVFNPIYKFHKIKSCSNNKWLNITRCISKTLHSITYSDHIYQMQWKCRCDLPLVSRYSQSYIHVPINLNVKFPIMIRPTNNRLTQELVAIRDYVIFKIYLHSLVPTAKSYDSVLQPDRKHCSCTTVPNTQLILNLNIQFEKQPHSAKKNY